MKARNTTKKFTHKKIVENVITVQELELNNHRLIVNYKDVGISFRTNKQALEYYWNHIA